jgi:hypothetical protein
MSETYQSWRARRKEARHKRFSRMAAESNRVQAEARMGREPDADTARKRAEHDARGKVLREGHIYGTNCVAWQIVRSRRGRLNQVDCELGGVLVKTCSRREADAWANSICVG